MNIFVGKIGKSILFNPNSWGSIGGDNEAPKYYENLFSRNPEHTFYIIGANDYGRLPLADRTRINKHSNVVNVWDHFASWRKQHPEVPDIDTNAVFLSEWYKESGITFNTGVIFAGPTGTSNVNGKTTRMRDPSIIAKPLEMLSRYAGPMLAFLNETRVPYALIVNDPRYFPSNARDWFHRPSIVLSQYEELALTTSKKDYTSGETYIEKIPTTYAAMETIFLIGLERGGTASNVAPANTLDSFFDDAPEIIEGEKDINFMVVLNEGRPSRYKSLKSAILDHIEDVDVYGKWDPEVIGDDKRFKGSVGFHELQCMLPRVKYTYCIPIKKGWVTSKFWEMAHYGIIPFLHPTYDEQNHLKAPSILKVANSKELFGACTFLNTNENGYQMLRANIDSMLKDEFYSGKYLSDLTMSELEKIAV
jgi:hypothetical protein